MPIIQYKTQASLKAHFREIIDKIGMCDSVKIKHPEEFLDFCDIGKFFNKKQEMKFLMN